MEKDITIQRKIYKPPLSLFWVRLISFTVLAISFVSILVVIAYSVYSVNKIVKIDSDIELDKFIDIIQKRIKFAGPIINATSVIKYLSLALIAITSFALLYGSKSLNRLLLRRGILALASYIFLAFVIQYPLEIILNKIFTILYKDIDYSGDLVALSVTLGSVFCATSFANTNIFIDLFIMTLFYYFLFKDIKSEQKWKHVLFRSCAFIPVIYLGICMFLKNQSIMDLSKYVSFLLPLFATRKIPIYVFYLLTCLFFKLYQSKKQSEPSPLLFSIIISSILAFIAGMEFICSFFPVLKKFGLGENYLIIIGVPIIMLFNYKKSFMTRKTKVILYSITIIMFTGIAVWAGFVFYQIIVLLIPILYFVSPYISIFIEGLTDMME